VTSLVPFHWHVPAVAFIAALSITHHVLVRSSRERRLAEFTLVTLLIFTTWPIGDIAATVSLSVATVQRTTITLLVAPLLLLSLPVSVLARATRPAATDFVVRRLAHPGFAMVLVTVLGTLTLAPSIIDWGAHSSLGRGMIIIVTLGAGVVLWIPALGVLPGTKRLSPTARAGYVFVAALVVTSLSIVWIFARHPLYPALQHQHALLHASALLDQQIAGFVAKLGAYLPMWAVALAIFSRAEDSGVPVEESPLHWTDLERELERVDRQRVRSQRHDRLT
jgi:cytochrome c oxidase assembly factor CtaG